jgi:hypothetical protein
VRSVGAELAGIGFDLMFPFVRAVGGAAFRGAGMQLGAAVREAYGTGNLGERTNVLSRLAHPTEPPATTGQRVKQWIAQQVADWTGTQACFAPGTPLRTPGGARKIEDIRPGELVLSRAENNCEGPVEAKVVEEVFVHETILWRLDVNGQTIRTTAEHPFFVAGRGWVKCSELKVGERLLSESGAWVAVEAVEETGIWSTVYNVRIADYHTYFVGTEEWGFAVWAHNRCDAIEVRDALGSNRIDSETAAIVAKQIRMGHWLAMEQTLLAKGIDPLSPEVMGLRQKYLDPNIDALRVQVEMHHIAGEVGNYKVTFDPAKAAKNAGTPFTLVQDGSGNLVSVTYTLPGGKPYTYNLQTPAPLVSSTPSPAGPVLEFSNVPSGSGGHLLAPGKIRIIDQMTPPDMDGAFNARVEILDPSGVWIPKLSWRNGGLGHSTLFPESMSVLDLRREIGAAYNDAVATAGSKGIGNEFTGVGLTLQVSGFPSGTPGYQVRSAWPFQGK